MKTLKRSLLIATMLLIYFQVIKAQSTNNVLNVAGSSGVINGQLHEFSIGEMVLIQTYSTKSYALSQGFLQPNFNRVSINDMAPDVVVKNNIISPNDDGSNDYFYIDGLGRHPGSKLIVFDKAGRKIYCTVDYQNDWKGYVNGRPLNEDTYFYVIDLGPSYSLIKGSVNIVLN